MTDLYFDRDPATGADVPVPEPVRVGAKPGSLLQMPKGGGLPAPIQTALTALPIPVWKRQGTILYGGIGADAGGAQEASLLYETGPQVLTDTSVPVFKLWYTGGYDDAGSIGICYAESYTAAPGTWVKYKVAGVTAFVVSGIVHSSVVKSGSTYYMFGAPAPSLARMDILTSTNGIAWTVAQTGALTVTGGSNWDSTYIGNCFPFPPAFSGDTWKVLYEAQGTIYEIGLATAPNIGGTWTRYAGNPVLTNNPGQAGGLYAKLVNGVYWAWFHGNPQGLFPSDIYRASSPDLINWTRTPATPVLTRATDDEGAGSGVGQAADPYLCEANGKTYMVYEGYKDGTSLYGNSHLKLAVAESTLAQLTTLTNEGAGAAEPSTRAGIGNRIDVTYSRVDGTTATIPNNSSTNITWPNTPYNSNGTGQFFASNYLDGTLNFVAPVTGRYHVEWSLGMIGATSLSRLYVQLKVNGTEPAAGRLFDAPVASSADTSVLGSATFAFHSGDSVKIIMSPVGANVTLSGNPVVTYLHIEQCPE